MSLVLDEKLFKSIALSPNEVEQICKGVKNKLGNESQDQLNFAAAMCDMLFHLGYHPTLELFVDKNKSDKDGSNALNDIKRNKICVYHVCFGMGNRILNKVGKSYKFFDINGERNADDLEMDISIYDNTKRTGIETLGYYNYKEVYENIKNKFNPKHSLLEYRQAIDEVMDEIIYE